MSWTNDAVTSSKSVLNDGGSIFPDLDESMKRLKEVEKGKTYKLGRFEVLRTTKAHDEPFIIMELDEAIYSGYGRALGNQLVDMTKAAAVDANNEAYINERKAWTDISTDIPIVFSERTSAKGAYLIMEFAETK